MLATAAADGRRVDLVGYTRQQWVLLKPCSRVFLERCILAINALQPYIPSVCPLVRLSVCHTLVLWLN